MRRVAIGLLVAAAVGIWAGYTYSQRSSRATFITAPVEAGTITTSVKATGAVEAVITVDVSSQLSGRISQVFVNFNDTVKVGQPLAAVDPEIFTARVNEAKAVLKVAAANAQLQKAALRRADAAIANAGTARKVAESQLAAAQAKQDEAERDFQRNLRLSRTTSISDRELTQSQAVRDAGAAGVRALQEEVNMKGDAIGIAEAELAMAEANVQNAEAVVEQRRAALEQAELDLERTVIRAPIDGVIIKRDVNPGQTVAVTLEAKTLFKIAQDLREMEVRGRIDEADVGRLQPGQTAHFSVDAYPDRIFSGRVLQIRKAAEVVQNVVTYTAVISAPNPDLLLLPGMTAVLRVTVSDTGATLKIPNQALRFRPEGQGRPNEGNARSAPTNGTPGTVWAIGNDGSPTAIDVNVGVQDDNMSQLLSGDLHEGQQLIVGVATPQSRVSALGLRLGF